MMQQILKSLLKIKDAKEKIRTGLVDSSAQNWPATLLPDWRKNECKTMNKSPNKNTHKQTYIHNPFFA